MSGIEDDSEEAAMNNTSKEYMFTENMLLKSKLKSAEESMKEKEQKTLEMETNMIDANTELAKLKEELQLKNEQNELLVGEKNKLEENVTKCNDMIQKMFKE